MFHYKITLAYDGTSYSGWQLQSNAVSIQDLLQQAAAIVLRKMVHITGSGRTDAGVHAKGQVAHFTFDEKLDPFRLLASLNGILPLDIRILAIEETTPEFHARYSAKSKIYHYHLYLKKPIDPFTRLYSTHIRQTIDLSSMKKACAYLIGTHDFTSFANEGDHGTASRDPIRTMLRLDLVETENGARLEFEADGFLYKMVRNSVGTLLDVGKGKLLPEGVQEILAAKDRRRASAAAPPQGLFLMEVKY
ncbi:MAG: tRNA pseudouridine(38-40) synthase TruA [Chlamydiales bacterium]